MFTSHFPSSKNFRRSLLAASGLTALLAFAGCNESATVSTGPDSLDSNAVSGVLSNVSQNVIYATYVDLDAKTALLQTAITALVNTPTDSNLHLAQQAWRNARAADEADEGFLFGPVENLGVDANTDAWPLNETDLNGELASNDSLTKVFIDGVSPNLKGYHTIEYLIFGETGTKTAAQITARERQYLVATTASLKGLNDAMANAWNPTGGNFVGAFQNAGKGSGVYMSQTQALEDLLNGVVGICDEVSTGKIAEPFNEQNDVKEESRFSDNSDADFANNIRSVQNVFLGTYFGMTGNGLGLKTLILAQKDTATATLIETQTNTAIAAIQAMTPTFHSAIFNNKAKVQAAIDAVTALKVTLSSVKVKNELGLQ